MRQLPFHVHRVMRKTPTKRLLLERFGIFQVQKPLCQFIFCTHRSLRTACHAGVARFELRSCFHCCTLLDSPALQLQLSSPPAPNLWPKVWKNGPLIRTGEQAMNMFQEPGFLSVVPSLSAIEKIARICRKLLYDTSKHAWDRGSLEDIILQQTNSMHAVVLSCSFVSKSGCGHQNGAPPYPKAYHAEHKHGT